jgi:hypothetical protein
MRNPIVAISGVGVLLIATFAAADRSYDEDKARPEWIGMQPTEIRQQRLHGAGRWKAHGRQQRPRARWTLDLDRGDDGKIYGSVNVGDSMLFASGRIEGEINGRRVAGTIFDEHGDPVAKVNGVITAEGLSGSYTDRSGATGEWVWDGPLPQ